MTIPHGRRPLRFRTWPIRECGESHAAISVPGLRIRGAAVAVTAGIGAEGGNQGGGRGSGVRVGIRIGIRIGIQIKIRINVRNTSTSKTKADGVRLSRWSGGGRRSARPRRCAGPPPPPAAAPTHMKSRSQIPNRPSQISNPNEMTVFLARSSMRISEATTSYSRRNEVSGGTRGSSLNLLLPSPRPLRRLATAGSTLARNAENPVAERSATMNSLTLGEACQAVEIGQPRLPSP